MRVASAQLAPAFMQREATLDKVLDAMGEAAANGTQLIAFPETFVPGYPAWADFSDASTFDDPAQKAAFSVYLDNAVDIAAGHLDTVVAVSAQLRIFVYLGVAERSASSGSIYCSLVAISPMSGIVGVHRKPKPTYGERMMWADRDGNGLPVHDLPPSANPAPVRLRRRHPDAKTVLVEIAPAHRQRLRGDIAGVDRRVGQRVGAGNGDTPAAGAQIQHPADALRRQPGLEAGFDQLGQR